MALRKVCPLECILTIKKNGSNMKVVFTTLIFFSACLLFADKPNIVLIMTDDQGWGQTGYMNHPVLKTPNLDAMAANGLRFNRFYAAAPVCSPTRASVLTGRTNNRTSVLIPMDMPSDSKKSSYPLLSNRLDIIPDTLANGTSMVFVDLGFLFPRMILIIQDTSASANGLP